MQFEANNHTMIVTWGIDRLGHTIKGKGLRVSNKKITVLENYVHMNSVMRNVQFEEVLLHMHSTWYRLTRWSWSTFSAKKQEKGWHERRGVYICGCPVLQFH